jgi:EAL domain-containing protein (putative c-di-GMP-specific phosphodiesterase class I)
LEITESIIVRDTEAMLRRLTALKALGVRLAIDDFGTGSSSLGFLRRFPIDVLKIDKSFVDGLAEGTDTGNAVALARTIVALGKTLSIETVAEGVEGGAQAEALVAMGCIVAQGHHYSVAVTPAAIDALIDSGGIINAQGRAA